MVEENYDGNPIKKTATLCGYIGTKDTLLVWAAFCGYIGCGYIGCGYMRYAQENIN